MAIQELDANTVLEQFYQRLVVLEHELARLKTFSPSDSPSATPTSFTSLRGVWEGVHLSEQDIAQSHIKLPEL